MKFSPNIIAHQALQFQFNLYFGECFPLMSTNILYFAILKFRQFFFCCSLSEIAVPQHLHGSLKCNKNVLFFFGSFDFESISLSHLYSKLAALQE